MNHHALPFGFAPYCFWHLNSQPAGCQYVLDRLCAIGGTRTRVSQMNFYDALLFYYPLSITLWPTELLSHVAVAPSAGCHLYVISLQSNCYRFHPSCQEVQWWDSIPPYHKWPLHHRPIYYLILQSKAFVVLLSPK